MEAFEITRLEWAEVDARISGLEARVRAAEEVANRLAERLAGEVNARAEDDEALRAMAASMRTQHAGRLDRVEKLLGVNV